MKELEDYSWFPPLLRDFQLEFIGFVVTKFNVYDVFISYIQSLSLPLGSMTDLCSGSGEPAITIFRQSNCFNQLTLSDKYPNTAKLEGGTSEYTIQRADVLDMDFKAGTCYTMFNAFHHFSDAEKVKIVQNIQTTGSAAFFVEILEPTLFCLVKVFFTTTIGSLVLTPFIRPFSFIRLLLTYIVPVNLLAITFDGLVSVAKSRSVKQYQTLFAKQKDWVKIVKLKTTLSTLIVIHIEPTQ